MKYFISSLVLVVVFVVISIGWMNMNVPVILKWITSSEQTIFIVYQYILPVLGVLLSAMGSFKSLKLGLRVSNAVMVVVWLSLALYAHYLVGMIFKVNFSLDTF